jgi:hypothetical protein
LLRGCEAARAVDARELLELAVWASTVELGAIVSRARCIGARCGIVMVGAIHSR